MIQTKQTPINWTAIGIIATVICAAIGWLVARSIAKRSERIQRQEKLRAAISNFEFTIDKWSAEIADKNERLQKGWGVTLRGPIDFYAAALEKIRTASIAEIAQNIMVIRACLSAEGAKRLDKEWANYQEYIIEGIEGKDPTTEAEFTSHTECKNGLVGCLERLKQISGEIKV